jgi:cbb3-type cytochrome oxidase maturation protein
MSIVFVLLPLSGALAAAAIAAFVWAVRKGQLDDLDTPALRILHDDDGDRRISRKRR